MIRGTTPTHTFTTDISLVDATEIFVTYQQGAIKLEKTKADCDSVTATALKLTLTQDETLMFADRGYRAKVQIRAKFADGVAVASNISDIVVAPILKDGVI